MFIRKNKKIDSNTKQQYFTFQLIESFRTENGPRQRILLNLGTNLEYLSQAQLKELANRIEEIDKGSPSLIEQSPEIEKLAQAFAKLLQKKQLHVSSKENPLPLLSEEAEYVTIDLKTLSNEDCRTIGAESILLKAFRDLNLHNKLKSLGFSETQVSVAAANIISRAIYPGSEHKTFNWLNKNSALDELLGIDISKISLYQLYKSSDHLLANKDAIEKHLSDAAKVLFGLEEKIILYDITNTYFEGLSRKNKKAQYGRSKEKRSDCPLVAMGLVVDSEGFPKFSEVFEGNVVETKTFQEMILKLDSKGGLFKPLIAIDAGIASDDNVNWLKNNGYPFIVVKRQKTAIMPQDIPQIVVKDKEGERVFVAKKENKETNEILLYCQSESRSRRESGMKSRREQSFEEDLKYLSDGLLKKTNTIKDYGKVLEKIGRLKEKYKNVSSYYDVKVSFSQETNLATEITWKKIKEQEKKKYTGVYCLRANVGNISEKEIWEIYMMLTELEETFKTMKSELGLRPVFHQNETRVDGHVFISLLAYHLIHTVRKKLKANGINDRWENIRMGMSTQTRITTVFKKHDGELVRIRNTSKAEEYHKMIYQALKMQSNPLRSVRSKENL